MINSHTNYISNLFQILISLIFVLISCVLFPCVSLGFDWNKIVSPTQSDLNAIRRNSKDELVAVGDNGVIIRYKQGFWKLLESNTSNDLFDVWGNEQMTYAVGAKGTIVSYTNENCSSLPFVTSSNLTAIWGETENSENNIYVGDDKGTVYKYRNRQWQTLGNPTNYKINAIWTNETVSSALTLVENSGRIFQYINTKWNEFYTPTPSSLLDIAGYSQNDLFAVGNSGTFLRLIHNTWQQTFVECPGLLSCSSRDISGLMVWSPMNVYMAGNGIIAHYDGITFTCMTGDQYFHINDICGGTGSNVFAVGDNGLILTQQLPLGISLPSQVGERDGKLINAGFISVPYVPGHEIEIKLSSGNSDTIDVPSIVTIPKDKNMVSFFIRVYNDMTIQGNRAIIVTASTDGYTSVSGTLVVKDDDRGDIDGNKNVDLVDIILILQIISSRSPLNISFVTDIGFNGKLGLEDALDIMLELSK